MKLIKKYRKRFVRYALTFISTVIFLIQSSKCIKLFQEKESVSSSKIVSTGKAEFPSLSICADFFDAYKKDMLEKFNSSAKNIRNLRFPNTPDYESLPFFKLITLNLTELIQSIDFNFHDSFPGTKISHLLLVAQVNEGLMDDTHIVQKLDEDHWVQHNWLTLGRCYTYTLPKKLRKLNVRSFTLVTNFNLLVYIHHPGQFWWVDTDTKIPIAKNELSFLDVRHTVVHALPKIINGTESFSCSEKMDLGYDACYHQSFDELFYQEFQCMHPLMGNKAKSSKPICNIGKLSQTEQEKFKELDFGLFDHRGQDNCISPCATIPLTFGLPDTSPYSNGSFHQRVYFKKFIPVLKEVPKYPFESLVAEVGGYLGLLLGVSILDFLKVPDYVWNFFRK